MNDVEESTSLKIGVIGPTRIGKSTIINCLLRSGERLLTQTSIRMRWADTATEKRIQQQRRELEGWRLSSQFNPGTLGGTQAEFYYRLKFDPGIPEAELHLAALDHPGAWVRADERAGHEAAWAACRSFIEKSTVLLIPVDAVVLMETIGDPNRRHLPSILATPEVNDVVRDWARQRHQQVDEPALVILCPVRTESYFADNGGLRDRSAELFEQVRLVYGEVVQTIRSEAPAARIRYCPMDTVGCVEFLSAAWETDEQSEVPHFRARYRVRRRPNGQTPEIRMAGVDDVLVLIARHLFDLGRRSLDQAARVKRQDATRLTEYAGRDNGLWLNMWSRMSGRRARWRRDAANSRVEANRADELVSDLGRQLKRLAEIELSGRFRDL